MSGYGARCEDCGPRCEVCEQTAYCWSDQTRPPCSHDRPLCEECRIEACQDCRLEAEQEMYHSGEYDPRADPFFNTHAETADAAYWASGPREVPGSPGTFRFPEAAS